MLIGLGGMVWLAPWLLLVKNDDRQRERAAMKKGGARPIPFSRIMEGPVKTGCRLIEHARHHRLLLAEGHLPRRLPGCPGAWCEGLPP